MMQLMQGVDDVQCDIEQFFLDGLDLSVCYYWKVQTGEGTFM